MEEIRENSFETQQANPAVTATLQLLNKWELPELRDIFIDQEITVRALKYLTETEISELIPKIGMRTVFRAMLNKWRDEENLLEAPQSGQSKANATQKQTYSTALSTSIQNSIELRNEAEKTVARMPSPLKIFEPTPSIKTEITVNDDTNDLFATPSPSCSSRNQQSLDCVANEIPKLTIVRKYKRRKEKNTNFNVRELILNSPCGKKVFDFYEQHGYLDKQNRKIIVSAVILDAVSREINMGTAIYNNIKYQILSLFPNEKGETYFTPSRTGISQKGMLHYKYSNYKRREKKSNLVK